MLSRQDNPTGPLAVGTVFAGRYDILRVLRLGASSAIYDAQDAVQDARVALRVLDPNIPTGSDTARRFLREVRAVKRIGTKSDHVVRVEDSGVE